MIVPWFSAAQTDMIRKGIFHRSAYENHPEESRKTIKLSYCPTYTENFSIHAYHSDKRLARGPGCGDQDKTEGYSVGKLHFHIGHGIFCMFWSADGKMLNHSTSSNSCMLLYYGLS